MKILDTPRIGKCRTQVFYVSPYGECARQHCVPRNTLAREREHVRSGFGYYSRAWGSTLTEAGRQAWIVAGAKVPTAKTLNQACWRTGQQHLGGEIARAHYPESGVAFSGLREAADSLL